MGIPTFALNRMDSPSLWTIEGALNVNGRADGATITLAAPVSTARAISVQLTAAGGGAITARQFVTLHVFADAAGAAWATTGGSTGIADEGAGAILALVAKKIFRASTDATGLLELSWTDSASEVAFLGVELPSGRMVFSAALTI